MNKKIFTIILVLLAFFNIFSSVSAQEVEPTKRWFCLEADRSGGHRAKLFIKDGASPGEKPLPNHETIIVECISTEAGQQCTTGDPGLDLDLYGGSQISGDLGYQFQGLFAEDGVTPVIQPIPGNAVGSFAPVIWQDATTRSHDRKWLGLNLVEPKPDVDMGLGGEQLGTFDFETALKKCVTIAWDPAGRVFDSQSLEPVMGASVTLLKKRDGGIFSYVNPADPEDVPGGALINPNPPTLEDGGFSFVVIDGTYKLNVQSSTHRFPSTGTLNPGYSKAYANIYPNQTGPEIIQEGSLQYRDIPVDPIGAPVYSVPKIEYSYESDKISSITITGKVSHPLSVVSFYSVVPDANDPEVAVRYRLITTTTADRNGRFSQTIDQSTFDAEAGEVFGEVEVTKVDLTLAAAKTNIFDNLLGFVKNLLVGDVEAQTSNSTVLKLDPIPTFLQGFAYDSKGVIMPNATVGVYLNFTSKPYYETSADENGYFTIHSDYIPFQPYKLRYSSPSTSTVAVSTVKFLADNKTYLSESKIDPFKPNYVDPKINEKIEENITIAKAEAAANNVTVTPAQGGVIGSLAKNPGIAGMIVFIVLLLVAAGAVVFFMVRKNQSQPY